MSALERRKFIQASVALSALPLVGFSRPHEKKSDNATNNRFKLSLNAYSFNAPLRSGKITLSDVIEFCATQGFAAADLTAYYFPGYPQVPSDQYLYQLKERRISWV